MNNNWYLQHLDETRRRQDDIKTAEAYHLAKNNPLAPAKTKTRVYQRLFQALGKLISRRGPGLEQRYEEQMETPPVPQTQH